MMKIRDREGVIERIRDREGIIKRNSVQRRYHE
jgi:hypothetical protein